MTRDNPEHARLRVVLVLNYVPSDLKVPISRYVKGIMHEKFQIGVCRLGVGEPSFRCKDFKNGIVRVTFKLSLQEIHYRT